MARRIDWERMKRDLESIQGTLADDIAFGKSMGNLREMLVEDLGKDCAEILLPVRRDLMIDNHGFYGLYFAVPIEKGESRRPMLCAYVPYIPGFYGVWGRCKERSNDEIEQSQLRQRAEDIFAGIQQEINNRVLGFGLNKSGRFFRDIPKSFVLCFRYPSDKYLLKSPSQSPNLLQLS